MATIVSTQTQSLSSAAFGTPIDISSADFVSVQIGGTWAATWVFQASLDNISWHSFAMHNTANATSNADVNTATTVAFYSKPCTSIKYFRVGLSAYTSGTANFIITETMLEK